MTIEYNGESIEIGEWKVLETALPPSIILPSSLNAPKFASKISFVSEVELGLGDVFTEPASGMKYQITEQQGSEYWARML